METINLLKRVCLSVLNTKLNNMFKLNCLRCTFEWIPRIETRPKQCPDCKSRFWDEVREDNKEEKA